jgi:hypothetical protein
VSTLVAVFLAVTFAAGTDAPLGSTTKSRIKPLAPKGERNPK